MEVLGGLAIRADGIGGSWIFKLPSARFPAFPKMNATTAITEFGFSGLQGEDMVVVENTLEVHNFVVCTLCSCYPWPTLGLPPVWYKAAPYRARAVNDPRGVLKEFGTELPETVEVRTWDTTAELRYLVLPERPPGTENMTEETVAHLHASRPPRCPAAGLAPVGRRTGIF
jgi:hypothetical protein